MEKFLAFTHDGVFVGGLFLFLFFFCFLGFFAKELITMLAYRVSLMNNIIRTEILIPVYFV